jgi:hypothetical protein
MAISRPAEPKKTKPIKLVLSIVEWSQFAKYHDRVHFGGKKGSLAGVLHQQDPSEAGLYSHIHWF